LIELGSEYFEFWQYIEIILLSTDSLSLFVTKLPFDELSSEIWSKVIERLIGIPDTDLRQRRCYKSSTPLSSPPPSPFAFQSTILSSIPTILEDLKTKQWTMLYRGTTHGFSSSTFHTKCDGQSNTITLILTTKGFIFGGFTPVAWDSNSGYKTDNSQKSFLFTIKNPRNSEPRKFAFSIPSNAIYCRSDYGPTFGGNHDIHVANDSNSNNSSYTRLGHSYVNDTGIDRDQVFTGEHNFTVQEIEVFSINV
jgi:hypothetical protein